MRMWFRQKVRVLIFGTGAGGINYYKSSRGNHKVIGFLDNNQQKQGQSLFGKTIYAPRHLANLSYDKIIIASDYHREIREQLIGNLPSVKTRSVYILPIRRLAQDFNA